MKHHHGRSVGHWLPADQRVLDEWLAAMIDEVTKRPQPLHPVVEEFKAVIEQDAQVYMLFHQMFEELPRKPPFDKDPSGAPQVRDYRMMLRLMNRVITRAPEFSNSGVVGLPIDAILDWPMGTVSGTCAFLHHKVNAQLRKILNEWARFLRSHDSVYVLNEDPRKGWFGKSAMEAMPRFDEQFVCKPSVPQRGFISWDDFFTRRFRPGARPVEAPRDDSIVTNACEAAPYRLALDVKASERFWLKGQPYSLQHMLASDELAPKFTGGTVYQAFLSSISYHRWHAPVGGTVVKTVLVPGSYYAQARDEGLDPDGVRDSQAYLTHLATRALIFIQADSSDIGLMCFMAVGMAEVSSCDIRVYEGQHLAKGDPLGMFHYGGSTYCLVFRPSTRLEFDLHGQTPGTRSSNILVNARIARVTTG
jgi:phosphatidylserine decarboxylase